MLAASPSTSVLVFDEDLCVIECAGRAGVLRGSDRAPEGAALEELLPAARWKVLEPRYRAALAGAPQRFELEADGRAYDVEVTRLAPVGAGGCGVAVAHDVTRRSRTRSALQESEEAFRTLAEAASDVLTRSDPEGIYRYVSPSSARVYGRAPEELVGRRVREFLHPDDRQRHVALRAQIAAGADEHTGEFRMRHASGEWVWIETRYTALRDSLGRLTAVQASSRDVSERHAAEAERRIAEQHFQTAFDGAAIGMALVSLTGALERVNPALCDLLGRGEGELVRLTFQELTHPDDLAADLALLQDVLAGRRRSYQMEKRYLRPDGSVVWALLSVSVVRDEGGEPLHFVSQMQDISARKALEDELQRLALHDELTGLPNRRHLERELAARAAATDGRDHLVLLDLDGFKEVNDLLGHHAGDDVLRRIAEALRTSGDEKAFVARLGGDEFAMVLRHDEAPVEALEHVQRRLEAAARVPDSDVRVRASLGWATLADHPNAASALRAADASMYEEKRRRR